MHSKRCRSARTAANPCVRLIRRSSVGLRPAGADLKARPPTVALPAAQFHGVAHHRPQTFHVALAGYRRPISCGRVHVSFITRTRLAEVPVQSFNTPRGAIRVSNLEATAVDLVGYQKRVGDWLRRRPSSPNSPNASTRISSRQQRGRPRFPGRSASAICSTSLARLTRHRPSSTMCAAARATPCCWCRAAPAMVDRRVTSGGDCASTLKSRWRRIPARLHHGVASARPGCRTPRSSRTSSLRRRGSSPSRRQRKKWSKPCRACFGTCRLLLVLLRGFGPVRG